MSLRVAAPRTASPARPPAARTGRTGEPAPAAGARPAGADLPLQLRRRKKRQRPNARLADALTARMGVGRNTPSRAGAVAGAFLSHGLRGAMGSSGSLRNKMMGRAMEAASDRISGETRPGARPSLGATIAGHFKDSVKRRFEGSDLGRAYGMARGPWQEASHRGEIAKRKAGGRAVAEARRARRAAAPEEEAPGLGGLFDEPAPPIPASEGPPQPEIPAPPERPPVTIEPNPPASPVTVSMSGTTRGTGRDDEADPEGDAP